MDQITLDSDLSCDALVIPGHALERCLREANESQLKIYLYLLKNGRQNPTVSSIADFFNYSEQDVKRALRFWNCKSQPDKNPEKNPEKNSAGGNVVDFSKEKKAQLMKDPEVGQLMFIAQQYMGRPISPDEASVILRIYGELGFSADLVEYLLEYCITNNKKSFRSIDSVASEWKASGVDTLEEAKRLTMNVPKEMKAVMQALGFPKDRQPVETEMAYVRRWTKIYGYGMDVIREACARTVMSAGKPSIRYANSILKKWHEAGVTKKEDIIAVDEEFHAKRANGTDASKKPAKRPAADKFHNFSEREYDYEALLKDAVK
ncbi:MAG: DnaD domain protein [Lachnospiraceae bacterium]|nr:DnaD domain protein [Lachnospiraceae bacterium]